MPLTSRGFLRFLLFLVGYVLFLIVGASIFSAIEGPEELQQVKNLRGLRSNFLTQHSCVAGKILLKSLRKSIEQEIELSKEAAKLRYSVKETENTVEPQHMSLEEAKLILHVDKSSSADIEKRFKHLFEVNSKKKGGSFYLQSKVYRAKERLELEMKHMSHGKI